MTFFLHRSFPLRFRWHRGCFPCHFFGCPPYPRSLATGLLRLASLLACSCSACAFHDWTCALFCRPTGHLWFGPVSDLFLFWWPASGWSISTCLDTRLPIRCRHQLRAILRLLIWFCGLLPCIFFRWGAGNSISACCCFACVRRHSRLFHSTPLLDRRL